ncbi:MAG: GFA family protein [Pseudomonadota bacterium]
MPDGSCLCGDIRFEYPRDAVGVTTACHCGQCRKQSGHVWAIAEVPKVQVSIEGAPCWYSSSPGTERGFCPRCGSVLFWRAEDEDLMSVSLGALDGPTSLKLESHIFVKDKGDYYEIADGLPQHAAFEEDADA